MAGVAACRCGSWRPASSVACPLLLNSRATGSQLLLALHTLAGELLALPVASKVGRARKGQDQRIDDHRTRVATVVTRSTHCANGLAMQPVPSLTRTAILRAFMLRAETNARFAPSIRDESQTWRSRSRPREDHSARREVVVSAIVKCVTWLLEDQVDRGRPGSSKTNVFRRLCNVQRPNR
jgi:hypothetical protein